MIEELDGVILTCDLPEHGLSAGDIGTAVLLHRGSAGYEVEFTALDGDTIAVVTLMANQVRPAQTGEIAHVRALAAGEHRLEMGRLVFACDDVGLDLFEPDRFGPAT